MKASKMVTNPRSVLLTLDALDTLYHPRVPIALQYLRSARNYKLPIPPEVDQSAVAKAFYTAFKAEEAQRPNYGHSDALRGLHQGPREWWSEVIRNCLREVCTNTAEVGKGLEKHNKKVAIPDNLVDELIRIYDTAEGYVLYDDVIPFFAKLKTLRDAFYARAKHEGEDKPLFIVAIVSNSTGKLHEILRDLGLQVDRSLFMEKPDKEDLSHLKREYADIDYVITSYEIGYQKPDPKVFEFAADMAAYPEKMQNRRNDWYMIHVGDHYRKDAEGAVKAGWDKSFLLQRTTDAKQSRTLQNTSLVQVDSLLDVFKHLELPFSHEGKTEESHTI